MFDSRGAAVAASSPGALRDLLLWSTLVLAFSPLLVDLSAHLRARTWANYGLLFVVLLVVLARREPSRGLSHRDGYWLLAAVLVLQAVAVGGGFARWDRLAIPLGVLGLARLLGRPSPRVAALCGLPALPLQAPSVLVALVVSVGGASRAAQAWLSRGIFLALAAAGLAIAPRNWSPVRE
jgi:hypothetical protein